MNSSIYQNQSPLDQFIIRNLLSLKDDLLNLHISLTDIGLYLMIPIICIVATNYKTPKKKFLNMESKYLTVYSTLVNQINLCSMQTTRFGKFLLKHKMHFIRFIIPCSLFLLGINVRAYGFITHMLFITASSAFLLYFSGQYIKTGFSIPILKKISIGVLFTSSECFFGCFISSSFMHTVSSYSDYARSMIPLGMYTIPDS